MVRGLCIIFLLGCITYSFSAPEPIDTFNINLNLGEGTNTGKWEDGNTNGNGNIGSDNDYGFRQRLSALKNKIRNNNRYTYKYGSKGKERKGEKRRDTDYTGERKAGDNKRKRNQINKIATTAANERETGNGTSTASMHSIHEQGFFGHFPFNGNNGAGFGAGHKARDWNGVGAGIDTMGAGAVFEAVFGARRKARDWDGVGAGIDGIGAGCFTERNYNYAHNDLTAPFPRVDWKACRASARYVPGARYWTFRFWDSLCWLMSSNRYRRFEGNGGFISGNTGCIEGAVVGTGRGPGVGARRGEGAGRGAGVGVRRGAGAGLGAGRGAGVGARRGAAVNGEQGDFNGEWGNWKEWSTCSQTSKTCGGGRRQRKRRCNRRRLSSGGSRCRGSSTGDELCNTKKCDIHHSNSNPNDARVTHIDLNLEIDFQNQVLFGFVLLKIQNVIRENQKIILDCEHLDIREIRNAKNNIILTNWKIDDDDKYTLTIFMPILEASYHVKIKYSTTDKTRRALQWLREEETLGKRKPFLFSTCQATNCRTMLPCQDTPLVKFTYNANITVPSEITPVMSAIKKPGADDGSDGKTIHFFEQKIPIPSYLIGIAAGDIKSKIIGPRSAVWAEPEILKRAAESFKDIEKWLQAAENIFGPYEWEKLDILVAPKYPINGIEHPNTMFVSTEVAIFEIGTIIHEIIHSWAGNLVTPVDWGHMWLSEGIQQFFLLKMKARFNIQNKSIVQLGAADMKRLKGKTKRLNTLKKTNYFKLVMDFTEFYSKPVYQTPANAFPQIAYKKGSSLMWYLEDTVGKQNLEVFIQSYFTAFSKQSINSSMFETHFKNHFHNLNNVRKIDWEKWFYSPGNPPYIKKFNGTNDSQVEDFAESLPEEDNEINDTASLWKKLSFTQQLEGLRSWNGYNIDPARLDKLDALCNISLSPSDQIKTEWAIIGLKSKIAEEKEHSSEEMAETKETKETQETEDSSEEVGEDKETKETEEEEGSSVEVEEDKETKETEEEEGSSMEVEEDKETKETEEEEGSSVEVEEDKETKETQEMEDSSEEVGEDKETKETEVEEDYSEEVEEDKETKYALKLIEEIGDRNLLQTLYKNLKEKDSELAEKTLRKHKATIQDITLFKIERALGHFVV